MSWRLEELRKWYGGLDEENSKSGMSGWKLKELQKWYVGLEIEMGNRSHVGLEIRRPAEVVCGRWELEGLINCWNGMWFWRSKELQRRYYVECLRRSPMAWEFVYRLPHDARMMQLGLCLTSGIFVYRYRLEFAEFAECVPLMARIKIKFGDLLSKLVC